MYQIFVDRFYNGDPTNDVEDNEYIYIGAPSRKVKDWNQAPEAMDIRNFYGGDLQGVLDKSIICRILELKLFTSIRCLFLRRIISMIFRIMIT